VVAGYLGSLGVNLGVAAHHSSGRLLDRDECRVRAYHFALRAAWRVQRKYHWRDLFERYAVGLVADRQFQRYCILAYRRICRVLPGS